MTNERWVIDESFPHAPYGELLPEVRASTIRSSRTGGPLAIRLLEVVVHKNRKTFGEASMRLDALVVHGGGGSSAPSSWYAPATFNFDRVADGDALPIGAPGLLVFMGRPRHFLDLFLMVSRDRSRSQSLETLLSEVSSRPDGLVGEKALMTLAGAPPDVQVLQAALQAAVSLGDVALRALRTTTASTLGLYRASWLRGRDNWGIGRHPASGLRRAKDVSFSFEILRDEP